VKPPARHDRATKEAMHQILGYLNFSSGAADVSFLANLNGLFAELPQPAEATEGGSPAWRLVVAELRAELDDLRGQDSPFRDAHQAAAALELAAEHVGPGYLQFHADLLFHQTEEALFQPFFLGRLFEAILSQGGPWDEVERITAGAISQLNDYIGYRPVPALESRTFEPYPHEWLRAVPLYIEGAGVAHGKYARVLELTLDILRRVDDDLLREACLDPDLIDEFAVDPRAFDHDHPANRRPNYHFGLWDPHHIDNRGRYRRYVAQQVTLDSLMARVEQNRDLPEEECAVEAAAVLAGTVLMATGISGYGPDTHDSTVTLSTLLPRIAAYRDEFYIRLLSQLDESHRQRLEDEATRLRQPFGGARQHLNAELARRRATQLENVQLAKIFARMGFPQAAQEHVDVVPVASARMLCEIDCLLTQATRELDQGNIAQAAEIPSRIMQVVHRGIECGAIVDPWSILGFDAQFSLFPALENSIRDHRCDELVALMELIFDLYARVWREAAAADEREITDRMAADIRQTADWWRQFAAHEVSSTEATDPDSIVAAAERVANALGLWRQGGAASGDLAFWSQHADMFDSPKGYALVIESLMDNGDYVASMALLVHWLGRAEQIGLEMGDTSFNQLAGLWIRRRLAGARADDEGEQDPATFADHTRQIHKFLDYLEANAESFWRPPSFQLRGAATRGSADELGELPEDEADDADDIFGAAYEDVVFRDSADDGMQGMLYDADQMSDDELERESKRIGRHLAFLSCLADAWRIAALASGENQAAAPPARLDSLEHWRRCALENLNGLNQLLDQVQSYTAIVSGSDHDSMVSYFHHRQLKDALMERVVETCVDTADAARLLAAAGHEETDEEFASQDEETTLIGAFSLAFQGNHESLRRNWPHVLDVLKAEPLLYVPLMRGGAPRKIVEVRVRQRMVANLLTVLPRLGLIRETVELLDAAREMERAQAAGPGAVTEYDELFDTGCRNLVEFLVESAQSWDRSWQDPESEHNSSQAALVDCLEQLSERLLGGWLSHSRTLRLSVLERVRDDESWGELVSFIEEFGGELFTQKFLNYGNIRAILQQGAGGWLERLDEQPHDEAPQQLLDALADEPDRREDIEAQLTLVLEAVAENYAEYRDYNSTTTQSDQGNLLYTLLDFLRLRCDYDRVAWNLRPVVIAHDVLVRRQASEAAQLWRRALAERIGAEADRYAARLARLQRTYAMKMPTVADRINERFIRPMTIDRMRALIGPAIKEQEPGDNHPYFDMLRAECRALTQEPTGVGLDMPGWLIAIEEEVERVQGRWRDSDPSADLKPAAPLLTMTYESLLEHLDELIED